MGHVVHMEPRGYYLAHEVGRLAGTNGNQIGQWARHGLIRSSHSESGELPRIYSYQDVAEATIVHELLHLRVPHRLIRLAVESLRDDYGDWPLTHARLSVPGDQSATHSQLVRSLWVRSGDATFDLPASPGARTGRVDDWQHVMSSEHLHEVRDQLGRGGWAIRELPDVTQIEVNPDRLSGRPTIRDRRIPAEKVGRLARTANGVTTLREDYGLTTKEIDDARRWWARAESYERATAV